MAPTPAEKNVLTVLESCFKIAPGMEAELAERAGKAIPYKDLPEADYAAALKGFGLPDGLARAIASWDVGAAKGALFDDGHQLSRLIGRPTTPLAVTVADALTRVP
jgi:NAD(P)H dehydrogenase (quinone)